MVTYFRVKDSVYAVCSENENFSESEIDKLCWLFSSDQKNGKKSLSGRFRGPRREMLTPWSTNAVEITLNMGITGIRRIERLLEYGPSDSFDPMLEEVYTDPAQDIFDTEREPEPVKYIDDIEGYNKSEGLALSPEEIKYLEKVSTEIGRPLTDSEVFGFSQVNSEHCRHKIFNGLFIIDGTEMELSPFALIKKTSEQAPGNIVSAYKDNVAFIKGPPASLFCPELPDSPSCFSLKKSGTVLSLKAETHNFPTTVEPFNGASTGTGGEIRDRMAGGRASQALAGSAVYMTAYPRLEPGRRYEGHFAPRKWLYQTPAEILIKASNGASDFGNKFGQPLICGSLYTFEYFSSDERFGYDKVIMLAGGIGFAKEEDAVKNKPSKGDRIVVMGGDNYRIGMGGGAVSSVATGEYDNAIELNAVQRANPEMQKRVYNAIRAMSESDDNPVISIHDHGAGGHLNCLSELVEETGGEIELDKLPVGDPTLSAREIIGNESQERMGLVINPDRLELLKKTADRERAPFYDAGKITDDQRFCFRSSDGENPIDWKLEYMFGKPPRTVLKDQTDKISIKEEQYNEDEIPEYINALLEMEAVACKDWLTNKVDRSVTGRVALQQTAGPLQLPLNDAGVSVLDYTASFGIAESIGHAPFAGLLDSAAGSVLSAAEALTNIVWVPLEEGLASVSLSANWMWPAGNEGENARLYKAVEALSNFACDLGINIPTGKDSLSMTQKYPGEDPVLSPGTVIISAAACSDSPADSIKAALSPKPGTAVFYIDFSGMPLTTGGSSFAQLTASSGGTPPTVKDPDGFAARFNALQEFIKEKRVYSGHDISAGGLITALLEMCFPRNDIGIEALLEEFGATSIINILFAENPGVLFQADDDKSTIEFFKSRNIECIKLGTVIKEDKIKIGKPGRKFEFDIPELRDKWYRTSYLFDKMQSGPEKAKERYSNYSSQPLTFSFPESFEGAEAQSCVSHDIHKVKGPKAAIIREKGINGDREMAYSMYCAGFEVKDVHMTDLISGREDLSDIKFLVFPGGFSNSDVLGSAKGWAGAFMYNDKARKALDNFYARTDTLSLGVCNGCQLMIELGLIYPDAGKEHPKMLLNDSKKFESSFLNVDVPENNSIMLKTLSGSRLGVWVAHGEGKFSFPLPEDSYDIALKYSYDGYPGNPNGSAFNAAGVVSKDGRHLAMMPHLERAVFPWQWGYYPEERAEDKVTPWAEAFVNARNWIENKS